MQNEVDGWDVVREDEDAALSNHPTKEEAIAAAEIRADEERVNDVGDTPVEVDTEHVHEIEDTRAGMKPAFLGGGALLIAVLLIAVAAAIIAATTGFGS
ncbi:MAG: hypothetical protein QOI31_35 [Solirubrobacterales bacterium]|nr:hypothetical protein [Solirubrobacterales bacterium]